MSRPCRRFNRESTRQVVKSTASGRIYASARFSGHADSPLRCDRIAAHGKQTRLIPSAERQTLPPEFDHAPSAEPQVFRDAMSRVAGAVHLIATDGPGGKGGLTATAVTSVSDAPPTLLVCLNRSSRTAAIVRANGAFSVSTLGAGQQELANVFAGRTPARGEHRFEHGKWLVDALGQPCLADALVGFSCRVEEIKPVASHLVVIGAILDIRLGAAHAGLVYTRRAFHAV